MSENDNLGNLSAQDSFHPTNRLPWDEINLPTEMAQTMGFECLSRLSEEPAPPWLWEGFIAKGQITLLSGLPKVGKTTLLWHVLRQMHSGGELGGSIQPARILILSEEPSGFWAGRQASCPAGDGSHVYLRCRGKGLGARSKPTQIQWELYLQALGDIVRKAPFDLVVLDTWCGVGPVLDENSSGETVAALKPLHHLTAAGAAVLLIHHISKSDAPHGMGARGSNALPGEVDHVVEVRYRDPESKYPNQRHLRVHGRYYNHNLVYELREGPEIVPLGSTEDLSGRGLDIVEFLLCRTSRATVQDLLEHWPTDQGPPPGKSTIHRWLQEGIRQNRWFRTGSGSKGNGYLYSLTQREEG